MLFNSYIFLFLFLPLCLGGYFLLNRLGKERLALAFLFGMSLWFYGFFNYSYLTIILASIFINYFLYTLSKRIERPSGRTLLKLAAVLVNLGVFFYFKYFDFFLENINQLFGTDFVLRRILLPLGISFFTFQQLSFIIDACNGKIPDYDFLSYACFVSFFPQLIAGPIVTHDELVPQLMDPRRKRFDFDNFSIGLFLFAIGLAKKVLLADTLGMVVDYAFDAAADYRFEQINFSASWLAALCFTLQLYIDFSGYSDMAVGIGRMFNMILPPNFNSPYKAITIVDYWKRWHLTLTRFFTRYVYIPLGGNRRGKVRMYANILFVFFLSGFWHGAGWTFICWGLLHGAASCLCRITEKLWRPLPVLFNRTVTFVYVIFVNVFFRAANLKTALYIIAKMLHPAPGTLYPDLLDNISLPEFKLLAAWLSSLGLEQGMSLLLVLFALLCLYLVHVPKNSNELAAAFSPSFMNSLATAMLVLLSVFSFAGVSTFLYFNF